MLNNAAARGRPLPHLPAVEHVKTGTDWYGGLKYEVGRVGDHGRRIFLAEKVDGGEERWPRAARRLAQRRCCADAI
jgi:hypothetical protein